MEPLKRKRSALAGAVTRIFNKCQHESIHHENDGSELMKRDAIRTSVANSETDKLVARLRGFRAR